MAGNRQRRQDDYRDMLDLPHHVSAVHKPMSMRERAAQFSPFAALTGYDEAVRETARRTEPRRELDESARALLDEKLSFLKGQPSLYGLRVTYFVQDERKDGGRYVTVSGRLKRVDAYQRRLLLEDGTEIPIADIADIEIDRTEGEWV